MMALSAVTCSARTFVIAGAVLSGWESVVKVRSPLAAGPLPVASEERTRK